MMIKRIKYKLFSIFKRGLTENEKLIKNINNYEQKERQEQSQGSGLKRDQLHRQKSKKI